MPDYTYLKDILGDGKTSIPEILAHEPKSYEPKTYYGLEGYNNKRLPGIIGAAGDIDEYLAQNQSRASRVANGTLRLGLTTGTKFLEGMGYLVDLGFEGIKEATTGNVDQYSENFISRAADNGFSAFFSDIEDDLKEALPIYKTQKYKDASPFGQLWSLSFWTDDFVDGLAFMLSTWIPGGALSKMGMGSKIAGGLSKYAKMTNLGTKLQNLEKAGKGIDRIATWGLMTSSEAMFEAKDVKDAVIDQLYELKEKGVLNPTTGQPWTDETIKQVAAEKARNTYIQNLIALAPSNFIETGFIFGKVGGKIGGKIAEKAGSYSKKTAKGITGYLDSYGGKIAQGVGTGILSEGLWEENIQYSIQRMNEIHGDAVEYGKKWYYAFSDFPKAMDSLGDLKDDERLKNVILGGLLGMGGGARRGYIDKRDEDIAIDKGIKNVQSKYKAAFGMDVFAMSPEEKITYGTEEKDGETKYFKESLKEGEKSRINLSEFEYEKETRDNGIDPTKGGTIEVKSKPIATEDGNLVQSEQKIEEFMSSKRFIEELEDVIEAERNKVNPNKRKLDFFINEKMIEWAKAEFDLGRGEEAYNKLDKIGNMTPEELGTLGFDYRSEPDPKKAIQARKELVKEYEKIYNVTDATFNAPNIKKSTLINNQARKEEGYRIGARMAFLKRELANIENDFNLINEKDLVASEINKLVYDYEYAIAAITKAKADNIDATELIEEAEKLESRIKVLKGTAGLKEDTNVIRGKRTADSLDAEIKLIQRADIVNSLNKLADRFDKISDPATGYNYFVKSIKGKPYNERSVRNKIEINKNTTEGTYEAYEQARTKREFLFDKIDNASLDYSSTLLRKMFRENIPLLSILEKVRNDGLKLNRGSMSKIKAHVNDLLSKKERHDELVNSQMLPDSPALTTAETQEVNDLKKEVIDNSDVRKTLELYDEIIANKKRYTGEIKNRTIGEIHADLVNEYIEDGEYINGLVDKNKLFDNVDEIDKVVSAIERVKEIFSERETKLTSATLKRINDILKRLAADKIIAIKRKSDNEEQEKRLSKDITTTAFASLGIDIDKFANTGRLDSSVTNKKLYDLINRLVPSISNIIKEGSYIEYAIIIQMIKDSRVDEVDKVGLMESLDEIYDEVFEATMSTIAGKMIAKNPAFSGKNRTIAPYYKNPSRAMGQIMLILSNLGLSYSDETNPGYRYDKNRLMNGLLSDLKESKLSGKDALIEFFEKHRELVSMHDLMQTLASDYNLPEEITAEKEYGKKQQSLNNKKADFTPSPTVQQLLAIRMFGVFFNKKNVSGWNAWASMVGPAGSGKTFVFAKWIKGLLNLTDKEIYTVAREPKQAEIIKRSLTPSLTEVNTIGSLIDSLTGDHGSLKGRKLIVIDEAARLSALELVAINNALEKYNSKQDVENKLRILALSDPNQFSESNFPAISDFIELRNSEGMTDLPRLSILYRSTVPSLNDALNMFSNQSTDMRKETLRFKSNADASGVELYGAEGTHNFVNKVKELVADRIGKDDRRRAIIVSEQTKEAWKTNNPLENEISKGVAFLTVAESAGDNFDEVYVFIPKGDYGKSPFVENRAIYTAMSRAKYYSLLSEFNVQNIYDNSIKPLIADEIGNNVKRLNEFVEDRRKDEDLMYEYLEGEKDEEDEEEENKEPEKDDEKEDTSDDSYKTVITDEPNDVEVEEEILSEEDEEVEYHDEKPKSNKQEKSNHRSFHTNNSIFKPVKIKESTIPPIQEGDEVYYVVGKYQDRKDPKKKERRKVSVMQRVEVNGEVLFREVSVISKHDATPKGYEALFDNIKSIVDTDIDMADQFEAKLVYVSGGFYRITNLSKQNILGTGHVSNGERRSFQYDTKGTPRKKGFRRQLISAVVKSMYPKSVFGPIWGSEYASMINNKITDLAEKSYFTIFTTSDRKALLQEGYGVIPGLPHLVVPDAYSLERGKPSRTLYLRLDWQKMNNKDSFLSPLRDFVKKIKQIEGLIATKGFRMGNAVFNDFVSRIANNKELTEFKVNEADIKKFKLDKSLIGETITFLSAVESYMSAIKGKKFNISDELRFAATEVTSMLYTKSENGKNNNDGPIQKLFNSIARANNYTNGIMLQTGIYDKSKKKIWVSGKALLSGSAEHSSTNPAYRKVSEQLKRKLARAEESGDQARIKQAREEYDNRKNSLNNITLNDLETILGSELNAPIAISKFNASVKKPKESKNGRGVRNTFVAMHPSFVDIDIEGEYADKGNKEPKSKTEVIVDKNQKKADTDISSLGRRTRPKPRPKPFSKIILSKQELGEKISRETTREYLRRVIPGITDSEIKFVQAEEIMRLNDDKQAYGLYLDGIIYLLENKDGTVYEKVARHEAFHKIFNENFSFAQKTAFAIHFSKEYPEYAIRDNEGAIEYLARVEEEIANLFHEWRGGTVKVHSFIDKVFTAIMDIVRFITGNRSKINSYFNAIDNGRYSNQSGVALNSLQRLSKIREDYIYKDYAPQDFYRHLKKEIIYHINNKVSGIKNPKNEDASDVPVRVVDGVVINIPQTFQEAMDNVLQGFINLKEELKDKSSLNPDEDFTLGMATIITRQDVNKEYGVYKRLINDIYPTIHYSAFKYFREFISDDIEDAPEERELETIDGIIKAKDSELYDSMGKTSQKVRQFASTIEFIDKEGYADYIDFRYVYRSLLEAFSLVDINKSKEDYLKDLKEAIPGNSSKATALIQKLSGLIDGAKRSTVIDSNEGLPIWAKFSNTNTFVFSKSGKDIQSKTLSTYDSNDIVVVKRSANENTLHYFKRIAKAAETEYDTKGLTFIKSMYDKAYSSEVLLELTVHFGSLYRQNIWKGREENKFGRLYGYHEETDTGGSSTIASNISHFMVKVLDKEGSSYFDSITQKANEVISSGTESQQHSLVTALLNKISVIKEDGEISDPKAVLQMFVDIMKVYNESDEKLTNEEKIVGVKSRINKMADVMARDFSKGESFNYFRGDRKRAYLYIQSNMAMDVLRSIINRKSPTSKHLFGRELPRFLGTRFFEFNTMNPIPSNKRLGSKRLNKVYDYDNYDSAYNRSDKTKKPVRYEDELDGDFIKRSFWMQFIGYVAQHKTSKGAKVRYKQPFWVIGERGRTVAAEIDLLPEKDIVESIRMAIIQEGHRPDPTEDNEYDVVGYDVNYNKSYLPGMKDGAVVKRKTGETDAAFNNRVDQAVNSVLAAINEQADEFYNEMVTHDNARPHKELKKIYEKMGGYLSIPEGVSDENIYKGPKNKSRAAYLEQHRKMVKPLSDLWFKNYFINSHFLNQLALSDQAYYQDEYDVIKRAHLAFADGWKGVVGPGWMDDTFNVAVGQDVTDVIGGSQFKRFKKILGKSFNYTDGAGFMLPERFENIKQGFPDSMGLGVVMKPIYWGIDKYGILRAMKYATVVLTDDIVDMFPDLKTLRNDMRKNSVGEYVFNSAMKVGAPSSSKIKRDRPKGDFKKINPKTDIVELRNEYWRIQLNPVKESNSTSKNPTAIAYFANARKKNQEEAGKIFSYLSEIIDHGMIKVKKEMGLFAKDEVVDKKTRNTIRRRMIRYLDDISGQERTGELLSSKDEEDNYHVSMNMPSISEKLISMFISNFSKNAIEVRLKGSDLVLQTVYGAKNILGKDGKKIRREPKYKDKEGYAEVYMPDIYEGEMQKGDLIMWDKVLGFRIPSTDLHSAIPLKIIGFYPSKDNTNIIIAPKEIVWFSGADYDVDTLFIIRKSVAQKDYFDDNGELIIKGGQFMEGEGLIPRLKMLYRQLAAVSNKSEHDKELVRDLDYLYTEVLKNELFNNYMKVIMDEANEEEMLMPINMDRMEDNNHEEGIVEPVKTMLERIAGENGKSAVFKEKRWLGNVLAQIKFHNDNHRARKQKGVLVNKVKALAYLIQSTPVEKLPMLHEKSYVVIDGVKHDSLSIHEKSKDGNNKVVINIVDGELIYHEPTTIENFDILINAAIDNLKLQYLPMINLKDSLSNAYAALIGIGVPLQSAVKIMMQPALVMAGKQQFASTNKVEQVINKLLKDKPQVEKADVVKDKEKQPATINIYAGTNENVELSNFAERPYIDGLGIEYKNVEAAFQAAKLNYSDPVTKEDIATNDRIGMELQSATGAQAKKLGGQVKGLNAENWDKNSSTIMKNIIKESFEQNPEALEKLIATGISTLTHTQDKGKWGKEFPRLLMEVRKELSPAIPSEQEDTISTPVTESTSEEKESLTEGISLAFKQNPELAKVGTQKQYSAYLDTVFPNSKVKDIVYHGQPTISKFTAEKRLDLFQQLQDNDITQEQFDEEMKKFPDNDIIENFEESRIGSQSNSGLKRGFYFTDNIKVATWLDTNRVLRVLLDIKENIKEIDGGGKNVDLKLLRETTDKYDSVVYKNVIEGLEGDKKKLGTTFMVAKPEQIHILGSKQDVEEFKEFVKTKQTDTVTEGITSQELESTMFKSLEELTPDQLALQLQILKIFKNMDAIGKDMTTASHVTSIVQGIEGKYTALAKVLNEFDAIYKIEKGEYVKIKDKTGKVIGHELKDSFSFTNTDILNLPHINSAFNAIKFLKTKIGNIWFLHHKNLVKFSEGVYKWTKNNIKVGEGSASEAHEDIRRGFIRFMLSSFSFEGGPSMDTSNEEPYEVKKGNIRYDIAGAEAWSQRFIDRVSDLKSDNLENLFLSGIEIVPGWKGIKYIRFGAGFQSKIEDIHDYEDGFMSLEDDVQKDFLKYSIIHDGLEFGINSYTYVIDPKLFGEVTSYIDNNIYGLFARKNIEESKGLLDNLKSFFAMQYSANNMEYMGTLIDFTDRLVPFRDSKDTKDRQITGHEVVNEKRVFFNRRYSLKITKNDKTGEVKNDYNSFPLIAREFENILYKMAEVPGSEHVYYVNIGQKLEHKNYKFDIAIAANGYNPSMVYSPYVKTVNRSGDLSNLTKYDRPDKASYELEVGDTMLIKNTDDATGVTGYVYKVTKVNTAVPITSATGYKYTGISYDIRKIGPIEYTDKDPLSSTEFEALRDKIYNPESFIRTRRVTMPVPENKTKQQRVPIKDGVNFVFTVHTPELAKIGTQEQYSKYLDTIFPESSNKKVFTYSTKANLKKPDAITELIRKNRRINRDNGIQIQTDFEGFKNTGKYEAKDYKVLVNVGESRYVQLAGKQKEVYRIQKAADVLILGSEQDVEGFKEYMKTAPREQPISKEEKNSISRMALQEVLIRLRNKFGIRFRRFNDINNPIRGEWRNGTIWINTAHVKRDTPFHEYLHPVIEAIRATDKVTYNRLVAEINKHQDVIEDVRRRSPELNEDQIIEEAIVE